MLSDVPSHLTKMMDNTTHTTENSTEYRIPYLCVHKIDLLEEIKNRQSHLQRHMRN